LLLRSFLVPEEMLEETVARPKRKFPPRPVDATPGKRFVQFYVPIEIHLAFVMNATRRNVPVGNLWSAFAEKYAPSADLDALEPAPKAPYKRGAR
jgi:hypothetical protein